jgi:hypothetical protein
LGQYHGALARQYDPASGRWLGTDPLGLAGGSTDLYAYAGDDPVNAADPSGLAWYERSIGGQSYTLKFWSPSAAGFRETGLHYTTLAVVGGAVARRVVERQVVLAGLTLAVSAEATFSGGGAPIVWVMTTAGKGYADIGGRLVEASEAATRAFAEGLERARKSVNDMLAIADKFRDKAPEILKALVNDPVRFGKNLLSGVGQALKELGEALPRTLPRSPRFNGPWPPRRAAPTP